MMLICVSHSRGRAQYMSIAQAYNVRFCFSNFFKHQNIVKTIIGGIVHHLYHDLVTRDVTRVQNKQTCHLFLRHFTQALLSIGVKQYKQRKAVNSLEIPLHFELNFFNYY